MKLFSEYLAEVESHSDGTYGALLLTSDSRKKLHNWMEKQSIESLVDPTDYHCTVTYSIKSVPEISNIEVKFPIVTTIKGWEIFGDDKKMLVAVLDAPDAKKLFDQTIKMGAKSDYPEYVPHITVATNYNDKVPEKIPTFKLTFYKFKVAPLDTEFSYNDDGDEN